VIGRGALIDTEILEREVKMIEKIYPNIRDRIFIDQYAGILSPEFKKQEGLTEGELHQRIGSTGEGVGAARIARIQRDPSKFCLVSDYKGNELDDFRTIDTIRYLNTVHDSGINILLEGTQGCGLSLIHGPWPFVTSSDTNAAQLAVDCGLSPRIINQIMLVARTYPIRVAGNSGPMYQEIDWDVISKKMGKPIEERTTVTDKVRRVGSWDHHLMVRAVEINRPTSLALTFLDYYDPREEGKTSYFALRSPALRFIEYLESELEVPVRIIKTGEANEHVIIKGSKEW
jgi:adenylosuccinate synthase